MIPNKHHGKKARAFHGKTLKKWCKPLIAAQIARSFYKREGWDKYGKPLTPP